MSMDEKGKDIIQKTILLNEVMRETETNPDLGITQEYNHENRSKLWDSSQNKRNFKEAAFDNKKTYYDTISGQTLHIDQEAAKRKYHMKNAEGENVSTKWADHSAETDHVISIKEAHDRVKGNVFLTDEDLKDILNKDENYRLLSKSRNASKGEKSDFSLAFDSNEELSLEARKTLIAQKVKAEAYFNTRVAGKTIENAGSEFVTGSTQALVDSVIPLTSEAVRRLCNVASGKESLDEAAKGLGKTALDIAVVGGGKRVAADIVSGMIKNSQNAALQSIISSSAVNQIVAVGVIVKDSAVKYLNGEISGEEFIEEIGDKGVSMVAGMIVGQVGQELGAMVGTAIGTVILPGIGTVAGYAAGKIIGQVLGAILTTAACTAVFTIRNSLKHMDDYKKKESMIKRIEQDALKEMEYQRNMLKELIREEFDYWDKEIEEGFDQILCNASEGVWDAEGVAEGLDRILKIFGKEVRFHSINEYEEQLESTLQLSF